MIVASALSAGVGAAARLRVDPHRHRRRVGARGQVLRDHEVVDRQREDDQQARRDRRRQQRQQHAPRRPRSGGAPRSAAASSTSMPIVTSRPRTISTTHDSENVTCPITCAVVPSPMNAERGREQQEQADREHQLGRHQRQQHAARSTTPEPRPRQRCRPIASAVPSGVAISIASAGQHERCARARPRSVGSLQHAERSGPSRTSAARSPASDVRERPVVEREADRQQHRQQRPGDVDPGRDRQAAAAPRFATIATGRAGGRRGPRSRSRCSGRAAGRAGNRA